MYPEKPTFGTTNIIKPIRASVLIKLNIKDESVLPSPWRILESAPEIYINGHMNDSERIWLAARSLLNNQSPIRFANTKKNKKQNIPTIKQKSELVMMVFLICLLLPFASSSDTDGSNRLATEPVSAFGNIISGIAMPEKTP
jgi:hypothetical protein